MDRGDTPEARARIREKLTEQWRMRCPAGHADLRDNDGPTVYCRSCDASYDYDTLLDAREAGPTFGLE